MSHRIVDVGKYTACQLCDLFLGIDSPADYDAKTLYGPWVYLCELCLVIYGIDNSELQTPITWNGKETA